MALHLHGHLSELIHRDLGQRNILKVNNHVPRLHLAWLKTVELYIRTEKVGEIEELVHIHSVV